jgi:ribonuclease P protein component
VTDRLSFRPHHRLRSPRDFERVYGQKQRASDELLLIYMAKNDLPWSRVGFSVSRKHGNSVVRHRLRRLLREAFRLSQQELPAGWDFVLIPKQDASVELPALQASLESLAERVARRARQ